MHLFISLLSFSHIQRWVISKYKVVLQCYNLFSKFGSSDPCIQIWLCVHWLFVFVSLYDFDIFFYSWYLRFFWIVQEVSKTTTMNLTPGVSSGNRKKEKSQVLSAVEKYLPYALPLFLILIYNLSILCCKKMLICL